MDMILNFIRLQQIDLLDLIEITLVAYLVYRVLILWAGTRAFQILFGLVVLVAIYALARVAGLRLIESILSQAFTYGAFALIVVFQPELRSALARIGRSRVLNVITRFEERSQAVTDEIVGAAEKLAARRTGAIIAIERELSLEEFIDNTGKRLKAEVSAELLISIFAPRSPLHDGAVVIRGGEIVAAGVHLPLTQYPLSDNTLGTRHRAALGLSEETDAQVIVVSEETSQISVARRGVLRRGLRPEQLRDRLAAGAKTEEPKRSPVEARTTESNVLTETDAVIVSRPSAREGKTERDTGLEGEDRAVSTV